MRGNRRRAGRGFPARSAPAPRARPVNENALYSPVIVEPRSEREAASMSSRSPAMRANVGSVLHGLVPSYRSFLTRTEFQPECMWCRRTCLPLKMLIHKNRRTRGRHRFIHERRKGVAPPFRGGIPSRAVDANDVLSARLHQGSGGGTSCARRRFTCARSRRRRAHPRGFHRRRGLRASRDRRRDLRRRGCVPTAATWPIDPIRRRRPDIAPSRSIPASRPVPLFLNPSNTASGGFANVSATAHRTTSRRLVPAAAAPGSLTFFSHPPPPRAPRTDRPSPPRSTRRPPQIPPSASRSSSPCPPPSPRSRTRTGQSPTASWAAPPRRGARLPFFLDRPVSPSALPFAPRLVPHLLPVAPSRG